MQQELEVRYLYWYRVRFLIPRKRVGLERFVTASDPRAAEKAAKAIVRAELRGRKAKIRVEDVHNCGVASEQVHPQLALFSPEELRRKEA